MAKAERLDEAEALLDILADFLMLGVEKLQIPEMNQVSSKLDSSTNLILRPERLTCCSLEAGPGKPLAPGNGRIRCSATSPGPIGEVGDSEAGVEEELALELLPDPDRARRSQDPDATPAPSWDPAAAPGVVKSRPDPGRLSLEKAAEPLLLPLEPEDDMVVKNNSLRP